MKNDRIDKLIEIIASIPPIMHRKLHRDVFKFALEQVNADFAPHHVMIMKALQESGVANSSEISEMIAIAKPQMTHSVDKLIELGLVEREHDNVDRRKINIKLTQKGHDTLDRMGAIVQQRMKARLSNLSDDELEKLTEAFQYISDKFLELG